MAEVKWDTMSLEEKAEFIEQINDEIYSKTGVRPARLSPNGEGVLFVSSYTPKPLITYYNDPEIHKMD